MSAHGRIPAVECTCGLYVFKDETLCREQFGDYPNVILGKVFIWGRAIEHRDGFRAEYARIVSLITGHPRSVSSLLESYGIDVAAPRTKAEEGLTTAYLTTVDGNRVKLDVPVRDSDEVTGFFTVAPGVEIPEPVAHVTARFTPDRVITEFRLDAESGADA